MSTQAQAQAQAKYPLSDRALRQAEPPKRMDNTMREMFLGCPRKFYWWSRGYDYANKPPYFAFGSAWGVFKQQWYTRSQVTEAGSDAWRNAIVSSASDAIDLWNAEAATPNDRGDNEGNLKSLILAYVNDYRREPFKVVVPEVGWVWPLGTLDGIEVYLGGALDAYATWNDQMWVVEEKTTSVWLSDQVIRQWQFSSQIKQYHWFGTKFWGPSAFGGVIVNIAAKRKVGPKATTPQFARTIVRHSASDMAEFAQDAMDTFEAIYRAWSRWRWPKTTDKISCVGGIGKAPCLYQGLCLSGLPIESIDPLAFPNVAVRADEWAPWVWGKSSGKKQPILSTTSRRDGGRPILERSADAKPYQTYGWRC